jgi:hypothetical protein
MSSLDFFIFFYFIELYFYLSVRYIDFYLIISKVSRGFLYGFEV